jgi:hypothetical protein
MYRLDAPNLCKTVARAQQEAGTIKRSMLVVMVDCFYMCLGANKHLD